MTSKSLPLAFVSALLILATVLVACCPTPTPPPTEEAPPPTDTPVPPPPTEAPAALGSEERPIQVYFVPSVEVDNIITGGEALRQALEEATGLKFEVYIPTSYAAFVEGMCAAPEDAMGFPATFAYVVANARCGVDASMISVRYGDAFYYSGVIVPRDSDAQTLADLNGLTWAYGDTVSTSGYMVPQLWFPASGLEPGASVATGGHNQTVTSVYNGEADFGTIYFNPPQPAEGSEVEPWQFGDPVEPYADDVDTCALTEDGKDIQCGDWYPKDARRSVRDTAPDVIQKVRLLAISDPIPNDCLAFGPDFPADLRAQIEQALTDLQEDEEMWEQTLKLIYNYNALIPTTDAAYDGLRDYVEAGGLSMDDVVGILEAEE
ncbi:MAG: phosphate/phosphite/phosphonate ABC transporter substrate-binding protein [Anaerolineae bacterium]